MLKRTGKKEMSYNKIGGNLAVSRVSKETDHVNTLGGALKIVKEAPESKGSLIGGQLKVIGPVRAEPMNHINGQLKIIR